MSGNNKIGLLLMVVVWLTACKPMVYIPEAYSFKAKEIKNNPYGCWTSVVIKQADEVSQPTTVAGELLFMETDTLYLLISDRDVWPVYSGSILKAEL